MSMPDYFPIPELQKPFNDRQHDQNQPILKDYDQFCLKPNFDIFFGNQFSNDSQHNEHSTMNDTNSNPDANLNMQHSNEMKPTFKNQSRQIQQDQTFRNRPRRKFKTQAEKRMRGAPTKNLLAKAASAHFEQIKVYLTKSFIEKYPVLLKLTNKKEFLNLKESKGISMEDYASIYSIPQLRDQWVDFFKKQKLYRELLLSRCEGRSKMVYVKYLKRFEQAFKTKKFKYIR